MILRLVRNPTWILWEKSILCCIKNFNFTPVGFCASWIMSLKPYLSVKQLIDIKSSQNTVCCCRKRSYAVVIEMTTKLLFLQRNGLKPAFSQKIDIWNENRFLKIDSLYNVRVGVKLDGPKWAKYTVFRPKVAGVLTRWTDPIIDL